LSESPGHKDEYVAETRFLSTGGVTAREQPRHGKSQRNQAPQGSSAFMTISTRLRPGFSYGDRRR
jgi:hypothetical protein